MQRARHRLGVFLRLDAYHSHGILRGLARFAREHPEFEVLKLPQPAAYSRAGLRTLRLDAVVARVARAEDETVLAGCGLPVVNLSGQYATRRLAWVNTDDHRVGTMAAAHLQGRGYRHFAYCGNRSHLASQRRRHSFAAAVRAGGGTFAEKVLARRDESSPFPGVVRRDLAAWLRTLPRPVAILGFNDRVVLELAAACGLARLGIPGEVALVGVGNDLTRLEFAPTGITSIELPTFELGYRAACLVRDLLLGPTRPPAEERLPPPKIVTRRSTDHFAVEDEVVAVAIDHIREHRANSIYVAAVARAAGVSRRVLERRFRAALGMSVYQFVQRAHLERAEELMADPALTLAEVAYASGYENQRHLNLACRRLLGTTPAARRAELLAGTAGLR